MFISVRCVRRCCCCVLVVYVTGNSSLVVVFVARSCKQQASREQASEQAVLFLFSFLAECTVLLLVIAHFTVRWKSKIFVGYSNIILVEEGGYI